jgi:hypothetical protein
MGVSAGLEHRARGLWITNVRNQFFFERKNQKTFIPGVPRRNDRHGANVKKFFASFFQKRRVFLFTAEYR